MKVTYDPKSQELTLLTPESGRTITGLAQIAAHRRDPDIEAALPANIKAQLDKEAADAKAA